MAAPTTPILSTFTGGDEDPLSEGGNFAGPVRNGLSQCRRVSNQAAHSLTATSVSATSYWTPTQFAADQEVYATVPVAPPTSTQAVSIWGRIHNPGNASTAEAYIGAWAKDIGFRIFKMLTGSSFTQIGSTDSTALANNDGMWLNINGTALTLYHFTGGSWVQRVSTTDSSITGAGYIGMEFGTLETDARLDDFGGGAVGTGLAWITA